MAKKVTLVVTRWSCKAWKAVKQKRGETTKSTPELEMGQKRDPDRQTDGFEGCPR